MSDLAGVFAELGTPAPAALDVDWLVSLLPPDAGALLVAAADAGRLLVALAERGLHVHGVEASAAAVERCMGRLPATRRDTPVFRQDLDQLNVPFRYAGAVVSSQAWQSLDAAGIDQAVARVHAHLVAPGLLLLEGFVPDDAQHPPGAPLVEIERVKLDDGSTITCRRERRVDAQAQRIDSTERYERRSGTKVVAREDVTRRTCWRSPEEMLALVLATGFAHARIEEGAARPDGRTFAIVASLQEHPR